jgi:hypothetical protein
MEISPTNGPLCTRYEEIVNKCCELSPLFCLLVLLFDEWRDKFEGATEKNSNFQCNESAEDANYWTLELEIKASDTGL